MKAESPGPQVDKLVPKVQSTAQILYGIYFALTRLELVFLLIGRMPLFVVSYTHLTSSMVRQTQALPLATSLFSGPTPTPVARQLPTMWILIMLVVPETPTGTPAVTTASSPLCR